jgi:hypothetical protein
MKRLRKFRALPLTIALWVLVPLLLQAAPPPPHGPRIQFSETSFNFGSVKPSATLAHDFIITNTGDALLEITAVHSACACTTVSAWDRAVQPGKTGKISIRLDPSLLNGTVAKSVTVTCNDALEALPILQVQVHVLRPITVDPPYAYFMPVEGEETNETRVIRIVNHQSEDITLEPPQSASPAFKTELKTLRPGKEFELSVTYTGLVTNARSLGNIAIKTSEASMPVLNVSAAAFPKPILVAMPPQILLPGVPLRSEYQFSMNIRNNSRSPVKLFDPSVNIEGVKVQMHEVEQEKVFLLKLEFPPNLRLRPGQPAELSIKTSHPHYATFKVPIVRAAPPASEKASSPN